MRTKIIVLVVAILLIAGGVWFWSMHRGTSMPSSSTSPVATVTFMCNQGKSITASFYNGAATPQSGAGEPPTPTGRVDLTLSDGRMMSLPQTISADGARYSNGNPSVAGSETFVFWEKGNGAFVEEGASQQQTYIGCIAIAPDSGGLSQVYTNGTAGFSFRYPSSYTLDTSYVYQELGPGKNISGVKVTIPSSIATGTNLAADSYLSVEQLPNVQDCEASLFLGSAVTSTSTVTDGNTTYSYAQGSGAGAGNLYEEDVYALPGTNPCTAVRYFIHSTQLGNYPTGSVVAFDHAALITQFDQIRRTLTLAQ
jgi:membrane-bound inhibitor of C-type lysozyme